MTISPSKILASTHAPLSGSCSEVLVKCADGKVRVCCADSRKIVHTMEEGSSRGLLGQLDGSRMVYSINGANIILYNATNHWKATEAGKIDIASSSTTILSAAPLSSGAQLAMSTHHCFIYDIETQSELPIQLSHLSHPVATAMSPMTPTSFAAGFADGSACIIDTRSKKAAKTTPSCPTSLDPVLSIARLSKNRLAICQKEGLGIWELSGSKALQRWDCTHKHNKEPGENFVAMTPLDSSGKLLATLSTPTDERGSLLRIWSPNSQWANWLDRASGGEIIAPFRTFNIGSGKPIDALRDENTSANSSMDSMEILTSEIEEGPARGTSLTVLPDSRLVVCSNTSLTSKISVWV
eukprot:TRINITY_DN1048_c0_g1_i1.p1 TRINITY_DN1048_c0_g1~~TRINITY_DN1048_c0_g1_i1.p1  ORF type:complete len:353 (+),score=50.27 TRINITY_DN1048_c0_g1_i1:238-1296(+)